MGTLSSCGDLWTAGIFENSISGAGVCRMGDDWIFMLREDARYWPFAAACPLLLALSIGYIIPQQIVDINQPQNFIANNENMLSESQTVLSNNVGIATGLAWELKRSDIIMYDAKGEMKYGLSYPESRSH